jgi:hypothetical protein
LMRLKNKRKLKPNPNQKIKYKGLMLRNYQF